jgi:uncharacterized membrane protein YgcG
LYVPVLHARTLHWSALDVAAALDADGRLHVVERHAMVFDGDWNGGERRFRLRGSQRIQGIRVRRIDAATGTAVPLQPGDLDSVDHFAFTDDTTLRWRSRVPSDAPFQMATLVYELEYVLANVLRRDGAAFVLDHDFAFPDRTGVIEAFSLELTFDPAWGPPADVASPFSLRRSNLQPGASVVVTIPFEHLGAALPTGIREPTSPLWLLLPVSALLAFGGWRLQRYLAHEQRNGRFAPLKPIATIDDAWLEENVFKHRPEKVGSLWDNRTGAPEVAAILARLVLEGKLGSRIEKRRRLMHREDVLHLTILSPRPQFNAYESALIKALFIDGNTTDTERIRAHYGKRDQAFDPAAIIRRHLPGGRDVVSQDNKAALEDGWTLSLVVALVAAVAFGASLAAEVRLGVTGTFVLQSFLIGFASVAFGLVLVTLGYTLRNNVVGPRRHLQWLLALHAMYVVALLSIVRGGDGYLGWPMYVALAALAAWILNLALNRAYTRVSADRIADRKNLSAARAYFAEQLTRGKPNLEDAWYPYLIAFGLGKQMDHWFGRFGPVTVATATPSTLGPSHHDSSSTPSPTWSGGGGAFGGGGAAGAWSTAAGAMAAGVADSSSAGGGSGGGGGSSGGGGGGGW